MIAAAGISAADLAAFGTMVAALIGAVIAFIKLGGERRSLKITADQGAATIYDNLVRTLQAEVTRLNGVVAERDMTIRELHSRLHEDDDGPLAP